MDSILNAQQLAVICALSNGATMADAADQACVHRNTIANWRRNYLPFQHALAHAQYDRALLFREKAEALVDLAVQTIQAILTDPKAAPGVRLKAALAILQTASTPPEPKKQIILEIEKVKVADNPKPRPQKMHNDAQPAQAAAQPEPVHKDAQDAPSEPAPTVHNSAQSPQPIRREGPKIGRNDVCPCGSGNKFKRCCLNKNAAAAA